MKTIQGQPIITARNFSIVVQNRFPGYPVYAESEDIYNKFRNEKELSLEDVFEMKELSSNYMINYQNELNSSSFGLDLEIPENEFGNISEFVGIEINERDLWYH